ncbi:MAG: hypothetical protein HEQ12_00975 [Aphanizomenon flos-aquae DEX188]|nr:MAG: hypothetical protein HEQ12_00975 [Aphanizomenon flos-aquae DEX188]
MYNLLLYQKYVGIPKINRTPNIPKSDRTPTPSKQRFLRSASSLRDATANAIALPHPQTAIPTERFAIASHTPNSDSYGALVPSGTLPRTLSHPHTPKAIASVS